MLYTYHRAWIGNPPTPYMGCAPEITKPENIIKYILEINSSTELLEMDENQILVDLCTCLFMDKILPDTKWVKQYCGHKAWEEDIINNTYIYLKEKNYYSGKETKIKIKITIILPNDSELLFKRFIVSHLEEELAWLSSAFLRHQGMVSNHFFDIDLDLKDGKFQLTCCLNDDCYYFDTLHKAKQHAIFMWDSYLHNFLTGFFK